MTAALIISAALCKFCRKAISASIAHLFGNETVGYMCPACIVEEPMRLAQLQRELTALTTAELDAPGSPMPCAMCRSKGNAKMRLVQIDGRFGLICLKCEPRWLATNREKLGPVAQYGLKLR